jgi:hypothetical protein
MSSHSRNSRKATQAVQFAFAAALLAGSTAYAADDARTFELTAFSNTVAGDSLVKGDYSLAVQQLHLDAHSRNSDSVDTNRCVALAVTHQLEAAREACDAAVHDARRQLTTLPSNELWARSSYRDYLAIAYSNRAVVNWLSNDSAGAQADLKKAAAVAPKAAFVSRNLTALQSHAAVAQVTVAPKKS